MKNDVFLNIWIVKIYFLPVTWKWHSLKWGFRTQDARPRTQDRGTRIRNRRNTTPWPGTQGLSCKTQNPRPWTQNFKIYNPEYRTWDLWINSDYLIPMLIFKWLQLDLNQKPVQKWTLASLAKWLNVRLWTKWLWVRVQLQSLKLHISCLLWARSSLTFR